MYFKSQFVSYLLAFFVNHGGPGKSEFSFEAMPECGKDAKHATCELRRVCDIPDTARCSPPRWSAARGAWIRVETQETAARRYEKIIESLVTTLQFQKNCKDRGGNVIEECDPIPWNGNVQSLIAAAGSAMYWESGLREDIQYGYAPKGRGPAGEGCLMQVMPAQARTFAYWLTPEQKKAMSDEEIIQQMLGSSEEAMARCFTVGARILSRMAGQARSVCKSRDDIYEMYSLYGTGSKCSSIGIMDDFARKRTQTYERIMDKKRTEVLPDWAKLLFKTDETLAVAD